MTVLVSVNSEIAIPAADLPKQALLPEDLYGYCERGRATHPTDPDEEIYLPKSGVMILYYADIRSAATFEPVNTEFYVRRIVPEVYIHFDNDFYGDGMHRLFWDQLDWNGFKVIDARLLMTESTYGKTLSK